MSQPSPRMLARTLRVLLARSDHYNGQGDFADDIGRSNKAISSYENRKSNITYPILDRYQLALGMPNGIILCVSHIAAMTRDIKTTNGKSAKSKKLQQTERDKLLCMALYLRNLSNHLLDEKGELCLPDCNGVDSNNPDTWDDLLEELSVATQGDLAESDPAPFRDKAHLNVLVKAEVLAKEQRKADKKRSGKTAAKAIPIKSKTKPRRKLS